MINKSKNIYDYQNFINLLHPKVKINTSIQRVLQLDGDIRTTFIRACKNMNRKKELNPQLSSFDIITPSIEISLWNENDLKNFQFILKIIDKIYHVSYRCHHHDMCNRYVTIFSRKKNIHENTI